MKHRVYVGYWFCVAAIASVLLSFSEPTLAEEISFSRGQKLNHTLSVCLDKSDAISILDADAKDGFEAAQAIWMSKDRCGTLPVQGAVVGKTVKTAKVKRGDRTVTARIVEILADDQVIGYFFTTATVDERGS